MSPEIHCIVQDSQNLNALRRSAVENDVTTFVIAIGGANNFIALFSDPRHFRKKGKAIAKLFEVFEALLSPPFLVGVAANVS